MFPTILQLLKNENRDKLIPFQQYIADQIMEKGWYREMIEVVHSQKAPLPFRAAWGLETAYMLNPELFLPHKHDFLESFYIVKDESARRHYSKIMYLLLTSGELVLTQKEGEKCAETVCEWMYDPKAKIGNKVWCMDILSFLISYGDWIYDILEDLIEKEMQTPTPGMICRIKKLKKRIAGKHQ